MDMARAKRGGIVSKREVPVEQATVNNAPPPAARPKASRSKRTVLAQVNLDDNKLFKKQLTYGWSAGLIIGALQAGVGFYALFTGAPVLGFTPSILIDATLFGLFSFGAYRKNSFSAVALLVLYVIETVYSWFTGHLNLPGIVLNAIFLLFFFRGAEAVLKYNKRRKQQSTGQVA
jgi:hypothetical protein